MATSQDLRGRRVALVVDHPQRDLSGLVLVAWELCRRGATCHLVPLNLQDREVPGLAPDYVLLNYFRLFNQPLATRLAQAGIRFGVHDTEGGVWENPASYSELLWKDPSLRQKTATVCMWGPALAEHVVASGLLDRSQVVVTGCARFDFYETGWRPVLDGARDERAIPRILINTNFSVSNPRFTTRAQSIEYCHREYGWSYESIQKVTDAEDEAIRGMIALARDLVSDFPLAEVVLRPHPFENPEPYRRALEDLRQVEINDSGPVQPQIGAATAVVQRSCTTAIESVAAGVPTLSPLWIPAPYEMPVAEAVSVPCPTYADLRSELVRILARAWSPSEPLKASIQSVIGDWFYRIDGLSHRRVADAIAAGLPQARVVDERLCERFLYGVDRRDARLSERLSSLARYAAGLSPDFSFRLRRNEPFLAWTSTAKHLDLSEARSLLGRIADAARRRGEEPGSAQVELARERGDYLRDYTGHSLTVGPGSANA